jgi:MFS family permease
MIKLLRQRNFGLLWFAGLISLAGDYALLIGLPYIAYQLTQSTAATSLMFMARLLPSLLFGSMAGVFVDRWNRQRIMVASNLLQAVFLLPLLLIRSADWLWIIYLVAFAQSTISQFFSPAENAFLPQLVDNDSLIEANSLNALNNNIARLVGPPLGGAIVGVFGLSGVAIFDAVSFVLAATLIWLVRTQPTAAAPDSNAGALVSSAWRKVWQDWLAGLQFVQRQRSVRVIFLLTAATALGESIFGVLFVPFVSTVLQGSAQDIGWLMAAQAVGGLLGGAVIGAIGRRLRPAQLFGLSAVCFGIIDLLIFNYPAFFPGVTLALILFVLVGLPGAGFGAGMYTLLQTEVADAYRGRVFGAHNTTSALLGLVGSAITGFLGLRFGIVPVLNIQGFVYVAVGALALILLRHSLTAQRRSAGTPIRPKDI